MASTGPLVPSGLRKIALKGLINFEVFKSINTLCSLFIKNDERTPNNPVNAMKINDKYQDMEQILNSVLYGPPKNLIEECCVLAILIYGNITLLDMSPWASPLVALSHDLKNALEQTDLSLYWSGEVNLLLWVLFIGYASSHMQAQKSWFASLIRGLILNTNHKVNVDELEMLLKDFLYSEAHFGSSYMELWTRLVENS
jgi:hypothetical protein